MAFTLPDLPYKYNALQEQGMSMETLTLHHDRHHKAYVDNLNKLIAGTEWEGKSLEEIVKGTFDADACTQSGIFNNASQHWNHTQFWNWMKPRHIDVLGEVEMPAELEKKIVKDLGSLEEFYNEFYAKGAGQFGSGWVWLVLDTDGKVKVTNTPNGVNPLCFGQTALLGCDVWEHSYYVDFQNARPKYLINFIENLVDWENVAQRLENA